MSLKEIDQRAHFLAVENQSSRGTMLIMSISIQTVTILLVTVTCSVVSGLPFPAPNLQRCRSTEDCCTPVLDIHAATPFEFQSFLPVRTRPAANLVSDAYKSKLQRAYELMRALPDTDGRSLKNQAKLHCAYCDNNFYFEGNQYPLEIHQSWLFLPWHRLFVYFHERILARLIDDDTFALPFWYWDDPSPGLGSGNLLPALYAENGTLNDPDRGACAQRPNIVDFVNPLGGCLANNSSDKLRSDNAQVTYTHVVAGAVTPSLFFGLPYRFGDEGGVGGGTLECKPHVPVHVWVNYVKMQTNKRSAEDPVFYAHHCNVDRLWTIWKHLPGGTRTDLTDPDWLDTQFTFYDELGRLVHASVAQSLDIDKLRYKYQEVPIPWATAGASVDANGTLVSSWRGRSCDNYNDSSTDIVAMINNTKPFRSPVAFRSEPITFRVDRNPRSSSEDGTMGEEVLQLKGRLNWTLPMTFNAFLNLPSATNADTSLQGCRQYLGCFIANPHVGASLHVPGRMRWRVALRQKLQELGAEGLTQVAITLVILFPNDQTLNITSAKIFHTNE